MTADKNKMNYTKGLEDGYVIAMKVLNRAKDGATDLVKQMQEKFNEVLDK